MSTCRLQYPAGCEGCDTGVPGVPRPPGPCPATCVGERPPGCVAAGCDVAVVNSCRTRQLELLACGLDDVFVGGLPYRECAHHLATSVEPYSRIVATALTEAELERAPSGWTHRWTTVPGHRLPPWQNLGYDVAWPAEGRRTPLRVVADNTFYIGMFERWEERPNDNSSFKCVGNSFDIAADIVQNNEVHIAYLSDRGRAFAQSACNGADDLPICPAEMLAPVVRGLSTGNTCTLQTGGFFSPEVSLPFEPPGPATVGACADGTATCLNRACTACWSDEAVGEWGWRMLSEGDAGWTDSENRDLRDALQGLFEQRLSESASALTEPVTVVGAPFTGVPELCVEAP